MKKYHYIHTVLSHITDKQKRQKIEYELYDHLDEKEKWFESIGYDAAVASEKANDTMGDGDIVGEQLDGIFVKKHTTALSLILFVCMILFFGAYVVLGISECLNISGYIITAETIIIPLALLIYGANILFGIYRSRILNIACAVVLMFASNLANGVGVCIEKLTRGGLVTFSYLFDGSIMTFGIAVSAAVLVIIAAAAALVCIIIKTRLLQNSRLDLRIKRTAQFAIVITLMAAVIITVPAVITAPEKAETLISETENINKLTIQHADEFLSCNNIDELKKWAESTYGDEMAFFEEDYQPDEGISAHSKSCYTDIYLGSSDEDDLIVSSNFYYSDYIFLETLLEANDPKIEKFVRSEQCDIDDAPMLCELEMIKSRSGVLTLTLTYYNYNYDTFENGITRNYTYTENGFVFDGLG